MDIVNILKKSIFESFGPLTWTFLVVSSVTAVMFIGIGSSEISATRYQELAQIQPECKSLINEANFEDRRISKLEFKMIRIRCNKIEANKSRDLLANSLK